MDSPTQNRRPKPAEPAPGGAPSRSASIGILTYQRPEQAIRCLEGVDAVINDPLPGSWSIVEILVVDNDPDGSARSVVTAHAGAAAGPAVRYVHEPVPGVATARNRALLEARGDVLVFIDDDEVPNPGWPHGLLTVLDETGAALVGGPVLSEFTSPPPSWVVDGGFFERDDPPHRSPQTWLRSGNLAIDRAQIDAAGVRFDPRYRQGEDSAFTRTACAAGLDLRWSTEGSITEFVSPDRYSVQWRLRREYRSHRAWTRTSLDLAGGAVGRLTARARAAAIALVRAAQGTVELMGGAATGSRIRRIDGLTRLAGAAGRMVEIAAYRRA